MPRSDLLTRATGGALAALLALGAVVLPATPALAHNALVGSEPGQNTRLARSPEQIELVFTERLNAEYTTIVVSDDGGVSMPVDGPVVDQQRGIVRPVDPLPDGVYTVAYRVVSADGHPVQGAFRFAVNAPLTEPSTAASAEPPGDPSGEPGGRPATDAADSTADDSDGGGGQWWPYVLGLLVLVAGGGVAVVLLRRRRVT
ncbi:copper resistance protein CopC [Solwaraspora sp. WMMD406]|uniref:copper resistance CopC family protein n=1 Tax=Solwaraspora sp. WMMD406 TaxID=3016095 RepID=UPI0024177C71|nr:copper resistance CopC family protein [Solwaraspora sp. WMMD406]MDG4766757.1 copper resistance protein CopC [Solwaraspora sp. WMMD406]